MPKSVGTSSLFQSSAGGGPTSTKPVDRARPGSELERRTFGPPGIVISYVRTLRERLGEQGSNDQRGGEVLSKGRGQIVLMSWKRRTGACVVVCEGPPWQCAHERTKISLPCCSSWSSGGSELGSGDVPALIASDRSRIRSE